MFRMKFLPFSLMVAVSLLGACQTQRQPVAETKPAQTIAATASSDDDRRFFPADGKFPGRGAISGWKDFPKHNAERRALFASTASQDHDALVFVGDSITEGWQTQRQDFADLGVKIVNRGIGGDTTPNLLYRLQTDVLALRPRGLVLLIGTNDLGQGTAPADIAANLQDVFRMIRRDYPRIPIALCLVMPRGDWPHSPGPILELNDRIRELAATQTNVTLVDTFTPLAGPDGKGEPVYYTPDRLHLSPSGYAMWRDTIKPVLQRWKL